jgi:hypothetical protein
MHELGREPGRRPEVEQVAPDPGPISGLLLELAPGRQRMVLDRAGLGIEVERPSRQLEQRAADR